jgi:mannan endo-1,4-beta-mannosidase
MYWALATLSLLPTAFSQLVGSRNQPVFSSNKAAVTSLTCVTRSGTKLYENGVQFKWISYNIPNLLLLEGVTDEWIPPTPYEQESAILALVGSYGRVARTYTLGFGPHYHMTGLGMYYEPAWVAFDNALAIARKYKIRLIIPLLNNHNGGDSAEKWYGDYGLMAAFRGLPPSQFFTSSVLRSDMKDLISYMLNRINTVNGIRYADDCTVLAWELGNELGGWDGPVPSSEWTSDIAAYIKSIAPNALVASGDMGGLDSKSRYSEGSLSSPAVDMLSNHYYYGSSDIARLASDAAYVSSRGKAFFVGEFGLSDTTVYDSIYKSSLSLAEVSGAMIWSLRYHSRRGGFYIHRESDKYYSYHIPGFLYVSGFNSAEERNVIILTRKYGLKSLGLSTTTAYMVPPAPRAIDGVTSRALRFMGSPWAVNYRLSRKNGDTAWKVVKTSLSDGVVSGTVLFVDTVTVSSKGVLYLIEPKSVDGVYGPGLTVGPLFS